MSTYTERNKRAVLPVGLIRSVIKLLFSAAVQ